MLEVVVFSFFFFELELLVVRILTLLTADNAAMTARESVGVMVVICVATVGWLTEEVVATIVDVVIVPCVSDLLASVVRGYTNAATERGSAGRGSTLSELLMIVACSERRESVVDIDGSAEECNNDTGRVVVELLDAVSCRKHVCWRYSDDINEVRVEWL